jgi:carboxypeptidase T
VTKREGRREGRLSRAAIRALALALAFGLALIAGSAIPAAATPARPAAAPTIRQNGYPSSDSRYHDPAEVNAAIQALQAAHPNIVRRYQIGSSYQGRTIWAVKVSDNVTVDEPEPEVMFDSLHHAREHLTVEQSLALLGWLANGYGSDTRIRSIVNNREIWVIPVVNPDGFAYDLTGDPYRLWRKNRQPNGGSQYVGTDLNRNYGYRWGCCGGSSGATSSTTYRGSAPWSAPETRVIRDFVNSRVVGGQQQIRAAITFHSNGELVLWPYGYTRTDIPSDLTTQDHSTFVAIGRKFAALNHYIPEQSSDLYITDGDQIDWMYGVHRIFVYTVELYPRDPVPQWDGFYPPDEVISRETTRNRSAILYFLERAVCPYAEIGRATENCGAFFDDFEGSRGWQVDPAGTDTATRGIWQRGDPESTTFSGPKQLGSTPSGRYALTTGLSAGTEAATNDVDGGLTSIRSPAIDLPSGSGQRLEFRFSFAHDSRSSTADFFRVTVVSGSSRQVITERRGKAADRDGVWELRSASLDAFAGKRIRILIEAADMAGGSIVEAQVDDVRVTRPTT